MNSKFKIHHWRNFPFFVFKNQLIKPFRQILPRLFFILSLFLLFVSPDVTLAKPRTEPNHWFARAFFSYALPVSTIKDYINAPLGGRAEVGYQFGKRWAYRPLAFADFDTAKGKTSESAKSIDNYQSFAFGAGFAVGLTLTKDWGLSPYLALGYNIGQFKRTADTVDFRLPLAEAGLSLAYRITPRISAVYQLSYRHVFDADLPGGYIVNRLGVSTQW